MFVVTRIPPEVVHLGPCDTRIHWIHAACWTLCIHHRRHRRRSRTITGSKDGPPALISIILYRARMLVVSCIIDSYTFLPVTSIHDPWLRKLLCQLVLGVNVGSLEFTIPNRDGVVVFGFLSTSNQGFSKTH